MQVIIKSVHFKAGSDLEQFAIDKVEKFSELNSRVIRAHVTLSLEVDSKPENRSCEILLSIPGEDPYLKKTASSFEEAISKAAKSMEKVLRRRKPR